MTNIYVHQDLHEMNLYPCAYSMTFNVTQKKGEDKLTLNVDGKAVSKTWQEWSRSMTGSGVYAKAAISTKLSILSQLEAAFLETYYRIPLCSTTNSLLLSHQCSYYTDSFNVMYGFGGIRLLNYAYDDAQWADFVKRQGSSLSYE